MPRKKAITKKATRKVTEKAAPLVPGVALTHTRAPEPEVPVAAAVAEPEAPAGRPVPQSRAEACGLMAECRAKIDDLIQAKYAEQQFLDSLIRQHNALPRPPKR